MASNPVDPADEHKMPQKPEDPNEYVRSSLALFEQAQSFLTFDLETTGRLYKPDLNNANPKGRVMQVAARRYERGRDGSLRMVYEMNMLINDPTMTFVDPNAFAVHHISLDDCHRRGHPPRVVWQRLLDMSQDAVLVGQNILRFDIPFANREIERAQLSGSLSSEQTIDMLIAVRQVWNFEENKLRTLAKFFNVKTDPSRDHDALADIETCWQLWQKITAHDGMRAYKARFLGGNPNQYRRIVRKIVFED